MIYESINEDYLITAELSDKSLVGDVHKLYSGRAGQHYCDICAFHGEDIELCQTVRRAEIDFFDTLRSAS